MASFIAIPLKKTSEIDIVKPLKNFISSYYSSADEPVDCSEALVELNKLRMNSTWRTLDKHESSLEVMYRYYDQLAALEAKCPPSDVQLNFKWRDAFDKGSLFGGYSSLSISSISFEKTCILFNIAAMQSQIASSQGAEIGNDENLKSAAKFFQQSSGILNHLKNNVMSSLQQDPTPDLHPDTLGALQALMLAQAQESYFHKASSDKMKDAIIAKVAYQCEELYADALKQMQRENVKLLWDKDWLATVASKQAAFHSIAQYHQSLVCKNVKDVGEELCRLQSALDLIKAAEQRAGYNFGFKDYLNKITRNFEEAKKDNDFIYHARIPDIKNVAPIGKAALAKPIPIPEKMSSNSPDLFGALLPLAVTQALQAYDLRKAELVNGEIAKLRDATQVLNGVLASLNLPAALEDTTGNSLPQSVAEKADAVKQQGGINTILSLLQELPSLLTRNKEILDETDRILIEEEESDRNLREQFKERWRRTPSDKLNAALKRVNAEYRTKINTAVTADQIVQSKFVHHREKIALLSRPNEELQAAIPSGSPVVSSDCVEELKRLMAEVEQIKADRESIEGEIKSAVTDMKNQFLSALAADGAINESALSVELLGETYGPLQKRIRDSISYQENLLAEVQRLNTNFCSEKSSTQSAAERETVLRDLAAAHNSYVELVANLKEGTKFYSDLTELLLSNQNKISDFCFARQTEKEELNRELQQNIVNQPTRPSPAAPAHHQEAAARKPTPARPPPPSTAPTPPMSAPAAGPPQNYPAGPPNYSPYGGAVVPQAAPMGAPAGQLPYPGQYQQYPHYPPAPMPAGYNPYGQPVPQPQQQPPPMQQQYQQPGQGFNPYMQYPQAPAYYNYPPQQWR